MAAGMQTFAPLVEKCKSLGRAMRIGTNHGSLSSRILSYYGDTPRWDHKHDKHNKVYEYQHASFAGQPCPLLTGSPSESSMWVGHSLQTSDGARLSHSVPHLSLPIACSRFAMLSSWKFEYTTWHCGHLSSTGNGKRGVQAFASIMTCTSHS